MTKNIVNNIVHKFAEPLTEAIIVERPNRFIIMAELDGKTHRLHCPTTGKVGNFKMDGRPCLIEFAKDSKTRKTAGTVQAISLNEPDDAEKNWLGINQNASNRYVESAIRLGKLSAHIPGIFSQEITEIKREPKIENGKLDFLLNQNHYIEIKTPLNRLQLEVPEHIETIDVRAPISVERLIRQVDDISDLLENGHQALSLVVFQFDSPRFMPKDRNGESDFASPVEMAFARAYERGLRQAQVNFKITPEHVELLKCFELGDDSKVIKK